jgi:crotonobetainyl-CoA:carnitine CoA-transferase CaiB-like acyl-CoA transferase
MSSATATHETPAAPLAGIRVLEMGRLVAAPFCAQILGDLGADVIKIERAGLGDDVRGYGPPFLNDQTPGGASAYYLGCNRNKRSVAIDFSTPEGADLVRGLAATSHVFIENFKVGGLKKYGLDEEGLRRVRSDIIYLSVSGFGGAGPSAHRPATDVIIQGMSGLMSVTGELDGPPSKVGVPMADMVTGLYAAVGVISALYQNATSSKPGGAWVGASLLDSALATMTAAAAWSYMAERPYLRAGNEAPENMPSGVYACADGEILFQAGKDADFIKLCRALEIDAVAKDPRYAQRPQRMANRDDLRAILTEAIGKQKKHDLYEKLTDVGVICGPINTITEALEEPQVIASGVLKPALHPDDPNLKLISSPLRFHDGAPEIRRHPPRVGEHTASVLSEVLGIGDADLRALAQKGIVTEFKGA